MDFNDKQLYARIADELDAGVEKDAGLWLCSLNAAEGDSDHARILYTRHRLSELKFLKYIGPVLPTKNTRGSCSIAGLVSLVSGLLCSLVLLWALHVHPDAGAANLWDIQNTSTLWHDMGFRVTTVWARGLMSCVGLCIWVVPAGLVCYGWSLLTGSLWWRIVPKGRALFCCMLLPLMSCILAAALGRSDWMVLVGGSLGETLYIWARCNFDPLVGYVSNYVLLVLVGVVQLALMRPLLSPSGCR